MVESEFKSQKKAGKVTLVEKPAPTSTEKKSVANDVSLSDYISILSKLQAPKKFLTAVPTNVPKTFVDSIQFYDTGGVRRLYVYVNKVWRYTTLT